MQVWACKHKVFDHTEDADVIIDNAIHDVEKADLHLNKSHTI